MSNWIERRTKHELYDYACGRLRELRQQVLYGEGKYKFIADNALKSLEEINIIDPILTKNAVKSMREKFDA